MNISQDLLKDALAEALSPLLEERTPVHMNEQEAADYLRVARKTLNRWRQDGVGPEYSKLGPRRIVYRKEDLDSYVLKNRKRTA